MSPLNNEGVSVGHRDLLTKKYEKHVKPVLELNDKLRKLTKTEGDINSTIIVTIGDQSHGKSSVVEALSGVSLPRGQGMKTKLPLSLHLREAESNGDEYAELEVEGKINKKKIQLEDVASEIDDATSKIVGDGVLNIMDDEIELTVYRTGQTNLDLIDLPGITRAAGKNMPKDIEERIEKMYIRYMKPKEAVLLNVVSVHTDTGNSKAFKLSRELDEHRERTLLCFTKVDQYADGLHRLTERIEKDKESFLLEDDCVFIVRNRSQQETDDDITLSEVSSLEEKYFQNEGKELAGYAALGRNVLAEQLAKLQKDRILRTLPDIIEDVKKRLEELQSQFEQLPIHLENPMQRFSMFNQCLGSFSRKLSDSRRGYTPFTTSESQLLLHAQVVLVGQSKPKPDFTRIFANGNDETGWAAHAFTYLEKNRLYVLVIGKKTKEKQPENLPEQLSIFHRDVELDAVETQKSSWSEAFSVIDRLDVEYRAYEYNYSNEVTGTLKIVGTFFATACVLNDCAKINSLQKKFAQTVRTFKPPSYFFSWDFFRHMEKLHSTTSGMEGMPGSHSTAVAVGEARRLQQVLYPLGRSFLAELAREVRESIKEHLAVSFVSFETMAARVKSAFEKIQLEVQEEALKQLTVQEDGFDLVFLEDHYFSSIVKDYQAKIEKIRKNLEPKFGFLTQEVLQKMSNDETGILDDVVKLAAYWKAMAKLYTDSVVRITRLFLFSQRSEERLKKMISNAVAHDVDRLLSPTPKQMRTRKDLQKRIENMTKAMNESTSLYEQFQFE